jgi:hypothetical protein
LEATPLNLEAAGAEGQALLERASQHLVSLLTEIAARSPLPNGGRILTASLL